MNKIQLLEMLTAEAKNYREGANESLKRNGHMNNATGAEIPQADIDALLTDFINLIGMGIQYTMEATGMKAMLNIESQIFKPLIKLGQLISR